VPDPGHPIPRLVPEEPFPAYAYVPGKSPHPTRNAAHRGSDKPHASPAPLDPDHWRECRPYVRGIDLFNHGYYWEAHEAWESLWHASGRRGPVAEFLKGLIALAAAGVKAREGRAGGVKQHAQRARSIFEPMKVQPASGPTPRFLGLELRTLIDNSTRIAEMPEKVLNTADCSVAIVFEFQLRLEPSAS